MLEAMIGGAEQLFSRPGIWLGFLIVLPIAVKSGVTALLAIAAAAAMMTLRHNGFLAVITGLIVAVLARSMGL